VVFDIVGDSLSQGDLLLKGEGLRTSEIQIAMTRGKSLKTKEECFSEGGRSLQEKTWQQAKEKSSKGLPGFNRGTTSRL